MLMVLADARLDNDRVPAPAMVRSLIVLCTVISPPVRCEVTMPLFVNVLLLLTLSVILLLEERVKFALMFVAAPPAAVPELVETLPVPPVVLRFSVPVVAAPAMRNESVPVPFGLTRIEPAAPVVICPRAAALAAFCMVTARF